MVIDIISDPETKRNRPSQAADGSKHETWESIFAVLEEKPFISKLSLSKAAEISINVHSVKCFGVLSPFSISFRT